MKNVGDLLARAAQKIVMENVGGLLARAAQKIVMENAIGNQIVEGLN